MRNKKLEIKTIVLIGLLAAVAAALSWLERFIPIQLIVPLPGLKIGFANIVTIFVIFYMDNKSAFALVFVRCLLGALFGGGITSFAFSITGALLAAIIMMLLLKGYNKQFSLYGISLAGSTAFNIGQVLVASFIFQDISVFAYLPVLMIGGTITGIITASVSIILFKKIDSSGTMNKYKI